MPFRIGVFYRVGGETQGGYPGTNAATNDEFSSIDLHASTPVPQIILAILGHSPRALNASDDTHLNAINTRAINARNERAKF